MLLTNLPTYTLANVALPVLPSNVQLKWMENGDVEIINAAEELQDQIKTAIHVAAGVAAVPMPVVAARSGARQWFVDNPVTLGLFTSTIPVLEAEISSLVDALFPAATAGNRTKLKKLLTAIVVSLRVLVRRELTD